MYPRIPWEPFSHPLGFAEHTLDTTRLVELGFDTCQRQEYIFLFFKAFRPGQAISVPKAPSTMVLENVKNYSSNDTESYPKLNLVCPFRFLIIFWSYVFIFSCSLASLVNMRKWTQYFCWYIFPLYTNTTLVLMFLFLPGMRIYWQRRKRRPTGRRSIPSMRTLS